MHSAAQLHALKPVQNEQRALDAPQLAQGQGQAILAWIALHYMMYVTPCVRIDVASL
jgi:hypothetical protein